MLSAILISSSVNINFIHVINNKKYNTSYEMNETHDSIGNVIFDKKHMSQGIVFIEVYIHKKTYLKYKISINNQDREIIVKMSKTEYNTVSKSTTVK